MNFKDFKGMKYIQNISDKYELGEILGQGQFGIVKLCKHKQAKVTLAMKIISKEMVKSSKINQKLMKSELQILEDISHPNIVRIFELLEDDSYYYCVAEIMKHGELYEYAKLRN